MVIIRKSLVLALGVALLTPTGVVSALAKSSIHQAAAERLQHKLGTIRGSIDRDAHNVFLTLGMIERLKPFRLEDEVAEQSQQTSLRNDKDATVTGGVAAKPGHKPVLNSTMPDTADMDAIVDAVERMTRDNTTR
ncbi:MAG: hypothetical protein AAGF28_06625 [Pseudomonadota bacterium]